ncbi:MAG: tRNA threonylcarbamoyladenosine dehydratase [Christensenella sp.]|nr:tRNA threonylcarbamoyladenosine dehydratase [Christensenella sp.]
MDDSRTRALIGDAASDRLKKTTVAVFGVGGVGSYAAEALARAGVGTLVLIDDDVVKPSNCNRQLVALSSTIGMRKTQVMRERIMDINPQARVVTHEIFYNADTATQVFEGIKIDFVVDAIDSLPSKIELICECARRGLSTISAMGAGNKLYPERFEVTDLFRTSYDPIAKRLRKELKERGIRRLPVVCSTEQPVSTSASEDGKRVPASISFVPSVCGLLMAGYAVRTITEAAK